MPNDAITLEQLHASVAQLTAASELIVEELGRTREDRGEQRGLLAAQHTELKDAAKRVEAQLTRLSQDLGSSRIETAQRQGAPWSLVWVLTVAWILLVLVMIGLYAQANGDDAGKAINDATSAVHVLSDPAGLPTVPPAATGGR